MRAEIKLKIVLVGLGGQGVLFATKLLSETALRLGNDIIGAETHGMSQRGGSVISHLKIGSPGGPLVRRGTADVLLALDADEATKALGFLRDGGVGFVNSSRQDDPHPDIAARLVERSIELHTLDADGLALELGSLASANVAVIGFALAHPANSFPYSAVRETLARISRERFRASNLEALARGYASNPASQLTTQRTIHER